MNRAAFGLARRHGPDPGRAFYKLHEELLWAKIPPAPKVVLIDMFHRIARGEVIPTIGERAACLDVSYDTVERAEQWLEKHGYLRRLQRPGKHSIYLGTFPSINDDPERAEAFESDFATWCEEVGHLPTSRKKQTSTSRKMRDLDLPQNAAPTSRKMREPDLPQNAEGSDSTSRKMPEPPPAKCGDPLPQNAGGSASDTLYSDSKTQKTEEEVAANGTGTETQSPAISAKAAAAAAAASHEPFYQVYIEALTDQHRDQITSFYRGLLMAGNGLPTDDQAQLAAKRARTSFAKKRLSGCPQSIRPVLVELGKLVNPVDFTEEGLEEAEAPRAVVNPMQEKLERATREYLAYRNS